MKGPRLFTTRFRVRYAETDQMGVVYHANYLVWMEVGRVEMMRELGFTYQRLEAEEGCVLPVVEVSCRYRAPARYDDLLEMETRVLAVRGSILKCGYRLRRAPGDEADESGEGALLAEATTTHIVVDRELKRRLLPEACAAALAGVLG
ncbi:MAG TPA: thioesterase family protein [Acidobacteriaceae bacterium]